MLGIACLSLLAAVAVYLIARAYPPEILEPFQATNTDLASQAGIFGSAASLFYTLAVGLVIGVCASGRSSARIHCLFWIGLALCLETFQHSIVSQPFSTWMQSIMPGSIWSLVGPYWIRGTFDPLDLLATLAGGFVALVLLNYLPTEKTEVIAP